MTEVVLLKIFLLRQNVQYDDIEQREAPVEHM